MMWSEIIYRSMIFILIFFNFLSPLSFSEDVYTAKGHRILILKMMKQLFLIKNMSLCFHLKISINFSCFKGYHRSIWNETLTLWRTSNKDISTMNLRAIDYYSVLIISWWNRKWEQSKLNWKCPFSWYRFFEDYFSRYVVI